MDLRVREFFQHFETANTSHDVPAIGSMYQDTFLFGGPNGVQVVKKDDFLRLIPKMKAHVAALGLSETNLKTVDVTLLDPKYLLAKVVWGIKTCGPSGSRSLDASATYILVRGQQEELSIAFQIDHQDLALAIRGQQDAPQ